MQAPTTWEEKAAALIATVQTPVDPSTVCGPAKSLPAGDLGALVTRLTRDALAANPPTPARSAVQQLQRIFADFDTSPLGAKKERLARAGPFLDALRCVLDTHEGTPVRAQRSRSSSRLAMDTPITFVKRVGEARAKLLAKLGVTSLEDALYLLPRRYEDRGRINPISQLREGAWETFCGKVVTFQLRRGRGRRKVFELIVGDESGHLILRWFNFREEYMLGRFKEGEKLIGYGKILASRYGGGLPEVHHPDIETFRRSEDLTHAGKIVPIYPLTASLNQKVLRTIIKNAVTSCAHLAPDVLPEHLRPRYHLLGLAEALHHVHLPSDEASVDALNAGVSEGHRRLIFEELFFLQLGLALRRRATAQEKKNRLYRLNGPLTKQVYKSLPFHLTAAQRSALAAIGADLGKPCPMNRLLQGDVGSGKTIVALLSMLAAVESGYQAAIMAPTEVLAEQHAERIAETLAGTDVPIALLTGRVTGRARDPLLSAIADGRVSIIVGTHALIQEGVKFKNLGLVVVDEQHRFGVLERSALKQKGYDPDVLVMTATPIPRSLSMTVYGDLDVSVIDEIPKGRHPVGTHVILEEARQKAYRRIRSETAKGRQGYIVYPLVEESQKSDLRAAKEGYQRLREEVFPDLRLGLIHGRMKGAEKETTMAAFRRGEIDLLVSTTVVEVGMDVPNCTLMLVEHAERFGLAQLHQLRGRIGRGPHPSICLLMAHYPLSEEAKERLRTINETSDGFVIAEKDLELRGPGDLIGTRQTGMPELHFVNLVRDIGTLHQTREAAFQLVEEDPTLTLPANLALRATLEHKWQSRLELAVTG